MSSTDQDHPLRTLAAQAQHLANAAERQEQKARETRARADELKRRHAALIETRSAPKPSKRVARKSADT